MTAAEIKDQVINKHHEGQEITLWMLEGERGPAKPIRVKIIKFNPNSVLIERKGLGYKESFSYWEFKTITSKPLAKEKELIIPERLRAEGRHKFKQCFAK